jgi:argininosuccinate lyase
MYIRSEIKKLVHNVQLYFELLLSLSEKYKEIKMPGYTHFQVAMPSSFGLWFAAYAESLVDDLILWHATYQIINKNPLGSAAGYGSSLPLNRKLTTELLGFESLNYNVIYAQMSRGKIEKTVALAIAAIAATIAKMCVDICLFMGQNFGFFSFPERFTTGSSIMPHKKNPDVFELIRARCNKLQALPNEIQLIIGNLPSGYHRDYQILKENFFTAFNDINNIIILMNNMLEHIIIQKDILADSKYKYISSVEAVNQLVMQGVPFRDAYQEVAKKIATGRYQAPSDVQYTHEGSIGNLSNGQIRKKMKNVTEQFQFAKAEAALARLIV